MSAADADPIRLRHLDAVNAVRAEHGLQPVQLSAELNAAAETHARDMYVQQRAWHFGSDLTSPRERAFRAGYRGELVGENLSEGSDSDLTVLKSWLDFKDTRDVILDPNARGLGLGWFQEPATAQDLVGRAPGGVTPAQARMMIGMPVGTIDQISSISVSLTAMQPAVQSFLRRSAARRGPPWMKMSPPGLTPSGAGAGDVVGVGIADPEAQVEVAARIAPVDVVLALRGAAVAGGVLGRPPAGSRDAPGSASASPRRTSAPARGWSWRPRCGSPAAPAPARRPRAPGRSPRPRRTRRSAPARCAGSRACFRPSGRR